MSENLNSELTAKSSQIGRNEPCPCGSGKKYKRCCGVGAAPKLTLPQNSGSGIPQMPAGFDPSSLSQDEQQQMVQFAQAFQRLPKGQLQRLQSIMQKAMSGKDVTREAAELEGSLPPQFKEMIRNFKMPNIPGMTPEMAEGGAGLPGLPSATATPDAAPMSEEEARKIVAQAAQEGKISQDQAQSLLANPVTPSEPTPTSEGGLSKFWKKLSGSKKTP